jgi:hypothetical protein
MPIEHPTNPTVVHRDVIAVPDNPGQLAIGEGVSDRQLHEVLLDVTGQERFDRGLAPRMRQLAPIDQSEDTRACKAAQVTPQSPIVEARRAALLRECPFSLQDRPNLFIVREGILIGGRVTGEEVQLKRAHRVRGHAFLLPSQQRSTLSNRGRNLCIPL